MSRRGEWSFIGTHINIEMLVESIKSFGKNSCAFILIVGDRFADI